ncbi:MAG: phosphonate metabolism protein PhnM [Spirochaetales bacterium]
MPILIQNGTVVGPDALLEQHDVLLEGGRITAIGRDLKTDAERIDASGALVMPGFLDIHADYIEHMAAPRPTSLMRFGLSLREAERELLTHGITTMFHSLSFYGSTDFGSNPIRSAENSRQLIDLIHQSHHNDHQIRHRFHARFEIDNLERVDELKDLIRDGKVHLLSFMDHSPGQGQYRDLELYKLILKGYRKLADGEADTLIQTSQNRAKVPFETLQEIAALARAAGIAVASHDDDTVEKLDVVQALGSTISEFPITLEVAAEAKRRGLHTVAGAPNVLLGGSHSGNLSATEAIVQGSVDVLCSDYYPASLLHAVFQLHHEKGLSLAAMTRLVSLNPARAVGLGNELGSLEVGKRADVLVVRTLADGFPYVANALVEGRQLLSTGYRL